MLDVFYLVKELIIVVEVSFVPGLREGVVRLLGCLAVIHVDEQIADKREHNYFGYREARVAGSSTCLFLLLRPLIFVFGLSFWFISVSH